MKTWIKSVRDRLFGTRRTGTIRKHQPRRLAHQLETLEDRLAPAVSITNDAAAMVITVDDVDGPENVSISILNDGSNAYVYVQGSYNSAISTTTVGTLTSLTVTAAGSSASNTFSIDLYDAFASIDYTSTIPVTLVGGSGGNTFTFGVNQVFATGSSITGGSGVDTLDYSQYTNPVTVNLTTPTATGVDTISGIENVTGGSGNDELVGNSGANVLIGGSGDDKLAGLTGSDTLDGGGGDDTYVLTVNSGDTDTLVESSGNDTISFAGGTVASQVIAAASANITIDLDATTTTPTPPSLQPVATGYNLALTLSSAGTDGYENFTGGTGDDNVSVSAMAVNRVIDGGTDGSDTLNVDGGGAQANLTPTSLTFDSPPIVGDYTFPGIENLNVTNTTGAITVNGSGVNDTVTLTSTSALAGSYEWTISPGSFTATVDFTSATSFTFNGYAGNDTFTLLNHLGGLFDPANGILFTGGDDTDRLNLGEASLTPTAGASTTYNPALGTVQTVRASTQELTFTGTEEYVDSVKVTTFTVNGTAGADTFTVSDNTFATLASRLKVTRTGSTPVEFQNKGILSIVPGDGADTIHLAYTIVGTPDLTSVQVLATGDTSADTFYVRSIAGVDVTLYGGANDDAYSVSSTAETGWSPNTGSLDTINANLVIEGGDGGNTLTVSDYQSAHGHAGVVITSNQIQGMAGSTNGQTITYNSTDPLADFTIHGADINEAETYKVVSPNGNLVLSTYGGDDRVNVVSLAASLNVNTGANNDSVHISSSADTNDDGDLSTIAGALTQVTIDLAGGTNTAVISDYGDATGNIAVILDFATTYGTISGFAPAGQAIQYKSTGGTSTLTLRGSNTASDIFQVKHTLGNFTTILEGNGGDDSINVSSDAPTNAGNLNAIAGTLDLRLGTGSGTQSIVVSDFSAAVNNTAVVVTNDQITGLAPGTIKYSTAGSGTDTITIRGSNTNADTFNVQSTSATFDNTVIQGNGGDDVVRVHNGATLADPTSGNLDGILGALDVQLGTGTGQSLVVSDYTAAADNTAVVTATQITGLAAAAISYSADITSTGNTLTVHGSNTNVDQVNVQSTDAKFDTTVNTNGGADSVFVGSDGTVTGSNLEGIAGALTVQGGTDSDVDALAVSDYAGTGVSNLNDNVVIGASTITGMAGATDATTITYGGFTTLAVDGLNSAEADKFTVQSPAAELTLNANGGNDEVLVQTLVAKATVNAGAGNDAVTVRNLTNDLDDIDFQLDVNLGSDVTPETNSLLVDDFGASVGNTATVTNAAITGMSTGVINYTGQGTLTIEGSNTQTDTLNVQSTSSSITTTTVKGNGGDDVVRVHNGATLADPTSGNLDGILGALDVQGGAGSANTLTVSDYTGGANLTASIDNDSIDGFAPAAISYSGIATMTVHGSNSSADTVSVTSPSAKLTLNTNGGGDQVDVVSLAATYNATVNTGAGTDVINVGNSNVVNLAAPLVVNGGADTGDTLNVKDSSAAAATRSYTVNALFLLRTGASQISFSQLEALNLDVSAAGGSTNTINVSQTVAGGTMPVTVTGGAGTDTLVGPNTTNAWTVGAPASTSTVAVTGGSTINFTQMNNLTGGSGADTFTLSGATALSTINGGAGTDTLNMAVYGATLYTLTGANLGTTGNAALANFSGVENITAGSGNDTFRFNAGASITGKLDAGIGDNWLDYSAFSTAVVVTLVNSGTGSATSVGGGIVGFNNVIGGSANDVLTGNSAANLLFGGLGADRLIGNAGADVLIGGDGADTIDGGTDQDMILSEIFTPTSGNLLSELQQVKSLWNGVAAQSAVLTYMTTGGRAVAADSFLDRVTGGATETGVADWFWVALVTTITDLTGTDIRTDI
ncbi:MAG: M10 family metallopeptidase C-terminal domain-containing protein [Gemmataceae bacterium]